MYNKFFKIFIYLISLLGIIIYLMRFLFRLFNFSFKFSMIITTVSLITLYLYLMRVDSLSKIKSIFLFFFIKGNKIVLFLSRNNYLIFLINLLQINLFFFKIW